MGSAGTSSRLTRHLLCPPRAGRGQEVLVFSYKGTNPVQGPTRLASPPPNTITAGTVFQRMHLGDTNIQSNTAGKGRMGRPDMGRPNLGKRALGNCPKHTRSSLCTRTGTAPPAGSVRGRQPGGNGLPALN